MPWVWESPYPWDWDGNGNMIFSCGYPHMDPHMGIPTEILWEWEWKFPSHGNPDIYIYIYIVFRNLCLLFTHEHNYSRSSQTGAHSNRGGHLTITLHILWFSSMYNPLVTPKPGHFLKDAQVPRFASFYCNVYYMLLLVTNFNFAITYPISPICCCEIEIRHESSFHN